MNGGDSGGEVNAVFSTLSTIIATENILRRISLTRKDLKVFTSPSWAPWIKKKRLESGLAVNVAGFGMMNKQKNVEEYRFIGIDFKKIIIVNFSFHCCYTSLPRSVPVATLSAVIQAMSYHQRYYC